MEFYKLEANGNDFIITILDKPTYYNISLLCNRNKGIGSDGYINIDNKFNVSIFNSDGSKANMCGNGLRCLVKLLNHLTNKNCFTFYFIILYLFLTKPQFSLLHASLFPFSTRALSQFGHFSPDGFCHVIKSQSGLDSHP